MSRRYWDGKDCLPKGMPWFAPGSAEKLEGLLKAFMGVLEFGGGGSTVFFAKRCAFVQTFDNSARWCKAIRRRLSELSIANVDLVETNWETLETAAFSQQWDVISVDAAPVTVRRDLMFRSLPYLKPGGILVLDNYAKIRISMLDAPSLPKFSACWQFDDEHWQGQGTAILRKAS